MIGRADVSGSSPASVNAGFITGQDGVFAVAANEAYVYWGTVGGAIGRAALNPDGSVASTDASFVTGAGYVEGVAIANGAIFWTDADHNRIGRATLNADGSLNSVDTNVLSVNGAAGHRSPTAASTGRTLRAAASAAPTWPPTGP